MIVTRVKAFVETDTGKKVLKYSTYAFNLILFAIISFQIYSVGIVDMVQNIPSNPIFYLIFLLLYILLPLSEFAIYKRFVPIGFLESQRVLHLKRVYNKFVVGYSGEVYLYNWLNKTYSNSNAFSIIRDNNTLSLLASWIMVVGIIGYITLFGDNHLLILFSDEIYNYFIISGLVLVVFVILSLKIKDYIFSLNLSESLSVTSIHLSRNVASSLLQALQWYVIIPDVSLSVWFNFVAIQLVVSKIPFISNKELIFISLSMYVGGKMDIQLETFTILLVMNFVLDRLLGLGTIVWQRLSHHESNQ